MTHLEGNKLIAEFMGGLQIYDAPIGWIKNVENLPNGLNRFELIEGKYHSSWDWLMPVVEKIESIDLPRGCFYEVLIANDYCSIKVKSEQDFFFVETNAFQSKNKIDAVWQTVIKFINTTQNV